MTVGEALADAAARLRAAGIEAPAKEARLLLADLAGVSQTELLGWPERPLPDAMYACVTAATLRRCRHEPLSRIVGHREFWSLSFRVTPDVLDPRPDTETLVETALAHFGGDGCILDLGTGSGCILLALLSERPGAWGLGIDRSEAAARVASGNAASLGLADRGRFAVGDWASAVHGRFNLVVSNPPYISSATIPTLDAGVRDYDPPAALDGGADGLDAYRRLVPAIEATVTADGTAVVEVGAGQSDAVGGMFATAGFEILEIRGDLHGIPRSIAVRRGRLRK